MAQSDKYIDYEAYIGYLRKVTGSPSDPDRLKDAVLSRIEENTELQTALVILKRLVMAASILLICALCAGGFGYFTSGDGSDGESDLWRSSRTESSKSECAMRLYEAYENSIARRSESF